MDDTIDLLMKQWARERPDLDARPMGLVGRVMRLSGLLEARVERTLKPFGLSVWEFDMLATLRRFGAPWRMSPSELMGQVMLSSGAMTNRIDRLEARGLVKRAPDPKDRRGVQVELTAKGRALADRAIEARLEEAREVTALLKEREVERVEQALRRILLELEERGL